MNDKPMITTGQFFTLIFVSRLFLTMIYSTYISSVSSLWSYMLPLMLSIPVMLIAAAPTLAFCNGKNRTISLCEYSAINLKSGGNLLVFLYAVYFFFSALYGILSLNSFMNSIVVQGIEPKIILVLLIAGCIYASLKGIEASSRMSAIVLILIIFSVALAVIFLIPGYHQESLVPSEGISLMTVTDCLVFILSRMNAFAAINILSPNTKGKLSRSGIFCIIIIPVFMIFSLILLSGTAGDFVNVRQFQVYNAIEGSGTLQRLDPIFILVIVCSGFCNLSLFLLASTECLKICFNKFSPKKLTLINGIVLCATMLFIPESAVIYLCNKYLLTIINIVFITFLPVVMIIYDKLKIKRTKIFKAVRSTSFILAMIFIISLFSGCGSIQLNQRLIIQGIGIDKLDDNYKLTLVVLDTENTEDENASSILYTEGKTVDKAIAAIENQRGRKVLLSQCLFIMMNEGAAQDCKNSLKYFTDLNDIQKSVNLSVSENSSQEVITTAINKLGYKPEYINVLSDSKAIDQSEIHSSLLEYISSEAQPDSSVIFPYVITDKDIKALSVDGSYVIDKGTGNSYYLDKSKTISVLLLNSKLSNYHNTDNNNRSYLIRSVKSDIIPNFKDEELVLEINININLQADEEEPDSIKKDILDDINLCLKKTLHQYGSDLFSIRKTIKNVYPHKKTENLQLLLKNCKFSVVINDN